LYHLWEAKRIRGIEKDPSLGSMPRRCDASLDFCDER
jgi:hypothetical protein